MGADAVREEQRWEHETQRRRSLAIKAVIPMVTLIVGAYFLLAATCHLYPFKSKEELDYLDSLKPQAHGFEEAKLVIEFSKDNYSMSAGTIQDVLMEAVDSKPSEIRLVISFLQRLSEKERAALGEGVEASVAVNGECSFQVPAVQNKPAHEVNLQAITEKNMPFPDDLRRILNQQYAKVYGADRLPVFDFTPKKASSPDAEVKTPRQPSAYVPEEGEVRLTVPKMEVRQ